MTQATTHHATEAETPPRPRLPQWLWPSWEHRKRSLYRQAWAATVAAWVVFTAAWLMPSDWTNTSRAFVLVWWVLFLVLTLQLHAAIALGVIALGAAMRRLGWLAATSGVLALILFGPLWVTMWLGSPPPIVGPTLRVMSVNLLMINQQVEPMLAEIMAADPDVILLQEYAPHWHRAMQEQLLPTWSHYVGEPQSDSFGIALYSRLPLEDATTALSLGELGVPQIRATVYLGDQPIDLYNVHLLPPRTLWYTVQHRLQFDEMLQMLTAQRRPYLIGGDFNFTDVSPQADALAELGLADAQDVAGSGLGLTWPVNSVLRYAPFPGIRLDHVYLSPQLTAHDTHTGIGHGSDHRPLVTTVGYVSTHGTRGGRHEERGDMPRR